LKTPITILLLALTFTHAYAMNIKLHLASAELPPLELDWEAKSVSHWDPASKRYTLLVSIQAPENYRILDANPEGSGGLYTLNLKSLNEQRSVQILGTNREVLSQSLLQIALSPKTSHVFRDESCPDTVGAADLIQNAEHYFLKIFCDDKVYISGVLNSQIIFVTRELPKQVATPSSPTRSRPNRPKTGQQSSEKGVGAMIPHTVNEGPDFTNLGLNAYFTHPFHALEASHDLKFSLASLSSEAFQFHKQRYYAWDSRFALTQQSVRPFFGASIRQIYLRDESHLSALTANLGLQHVGENLKLLAQASIFESGGHKSLVNLGGRYQKNDCFYQVDLEYFYASRERALTFIPSFGVVF